MSKYIVLTTINPPSEAAKLWAALPDWQLISVGDEKTPADWSLPNCLYIAPDQQEQVSRLSSYLPWNHYCRKMIGYAQAIESGAEVIVDTDDDNLPKPGWSWPAFNGDHEFIMSKREFVNVYRLFSEQVSLWPRGFPLSRLADPMDPWIGWAVTKIGVWQGLADEDPDVDAIYRMTQPQASVSFTKRPPVVLDKGVVCPFNSQNTAFRKEMFPLLYLPTTVSFRFTDILRGLVAQPIMWQAGYHLGFTSANVVQKRNPHDYMQDFKSGMPMYTHCEYIHQIAGKAAADANGTISENLIAAYQALVTHGIVGLNEIQVLEAWLRLF